LKCVKDIINGRSKLVSKDKETTLCSSFLLNLTFVTKDGDAKLLIVMVGVAPGVACLVPFKMLRLQSSPKTRSLKNSQVVV
jgi:hypothetical protein